MAQARDARCSFCGKRHDQVEKLIAGGAWPGVYICDECVTLCMEIISEELSPTAPKPPPPSGWMDRLRRMAISLPR